MRVHSATELRFICDYCLQHNKCNARTWALYSNMFQSLFTIASSHTHTNTKKTSSFYMVWRGNHANKCRLKMQFKPYMLRTRSIISIYTLWLLSFTRQIENRWWLMKDWFQIRIIQHSIIYFITTDWRSLNPT